MASHLSFTTATRIPFYFFDLYLPWQRGSNENGLLRLYLPKSTDLSVNSTDDLLAIQRSLNGRPRKTLGYKMPEEKLAEIVALPTWIRPLQVLPRPLWVGVPLETSALSRGRGAP